MPISIWIQGRETELVHLCDVLHLPEPSTVNPISMCPLLEKHITINIGNKRMNLYKDGILSAIAIRVNRMFTLVTQEIVIDKLFLISGEDTSQLTLW